MLWTFESISVRELSVNNELTETERLRRLAIIAMVSDDELLDRLVLKGGNLLDIAYGISTRASVDIDFSVEGDLASVVDLEERIRESLTRTFAAESLQVFDLKLRSVPPKISDEMKSFWGGYKLEFKIVTSERFAEFQNDIEQLRRNALNVGKRGSTRFLIDISNHEFCEAKVAKNIDGYTVFGYTPSMFVAEKLRAICQ